MKSSNSITRTMELFSRSHSGSFLSSASSSEASISSDMVGRVLLLSTGIRRHRNRYSRRRERICPLHRIGMDPPSSEWPVDFSIGDGFKNPFPPPPLIQQGRTGTAK
jgi:hypothetical protein